MWFIVDSTGYDTPDLIGPFANHDAAEAYAELTGRGEDDGGAVWIIQAIPPQA